jgi:hypothetical protein
MRHILAITVLLVGGIAIANESQDAAKHKLEQLDKLIALKRTELAKLEEQRAELATKTGDTAQEQASKPQSKPQTQAEKYSDLLRKKYIVDINAKIKNLEDSPRTPASTAELGRLYSQLKDLQTGVNKISMPTIYRNGNNHSWPIGTIGICDGNGFHVVQVIDAKNLIVFYGNENEIIWIENFTTKDIVDGEMIFPRIAFSSVGTKQYTSIAGAKQTITLLTPFE